MNGESIEPRRNLTETYRPVADGFVSQLGYSTMAYIGADGAPGSIYLKFRAQAEEIGEPNSRATAEVDNFQAIFREKHAQAFSHLPGDISIVLELETEPKGGHGVTLYF